MPAANVAAGSLDSARARLSGELAGIAARMAELPRKPSRSPSEQAEADELARRGRALRDRFLRRYVEDVYIELTDDFRHEPRVAELAYAAARRFPGLVPTREQIAAERELSQKDKDGLEVDQGLFIAHVLGSPRCGLHLIHSMSKPVAAAVALLDEFHHADVVDLGTIAVQRKDNVGYVTVQNHRFLNAEDDESTAALEIAVDLVLLDDRIEVGVLRGAPATHRKWAGRRVFGSGINLTHLYDGKISLIEFFLERELGAVNKIYRGHPLADFEQELEIRREKPWVAAVDSFAIGGGCQFLLVMDRVVAEAGAYVNLPAGKEGIIPGCGALRLPRFVGEGLARQAVFGNRDFPVDSPEGRLLVTEVASTRDMDDAVDRAVRELTSCGQSSLRANRRALRLAFEPLNTFRRYMANYALDQATCAYSPELAGNLERNWGDKLRARQRAASAAEGRTA